MNSMPGGVIFVFSAIRILAELDRCTSKRRMMGPQITSTKDIREVGSIAGAEPRELVGKVLMVPLWGHPLPPPLISEW